MILKYIGVVFVTWHGLVNSNPSPLNTLQHFANISYSTGDSNPTEVGPNFSPRMDFAQWKPLTGHGDPLRNDPTYDYEPPVLERVHYWADEPHKELERRIPERKSEVLVLGVSSRKPSVVSRQPATSPKRTIRPPSLPHNFEDYTFKYSEYYPMTILVPPPPPPPGHQQSLFVMPDDKISATISLPKQPIINKRPSTVIPEHLSSFAVQEANLIYQSSTASQNWFLDFNKTKTVPNSPITSDYAGWGPTTPFEDNDLVNETHNIISNDHTIEISKPFLFYKPMLSESPQHTVPSDQKIVTQFAPTALPPVQPTLSTTPVTWPATETTTTYDVTTESQNSYEETTLAHKTTNIILSSVTFPPKPKPTLLDMLGPMMSMPLEKNPDRPEDNLYAHASENIHVFKEPIKENSGQLQLLQNMQPPFPVKFPNNDVVSGRHPFHVNPHMLNNLLHAKPSIHTHDPYLHMRFTTPMTTSTTEASSPESNFITETPTVPMYLIIQGHSKVKTYSSKAKINLNDASQNEISQNRITSEVKHLHPLKEKHSKKLEISNTTRTGRAHDLKSLIDNGLGSIEIQETDIGIKYDVSDGSQVPVELYKKGIVDSDENNYNSRNKNKRSRRHINLDLINFNDDAAEKYEENIFTGQHNETSIMQLLAQAVISDSDESNELMD